MNEAALLRQLIKDAIQELRLMADEASLQDPKHKQFYQGVDAARDTLEIYFRRHLENTSKNKST